MGTYSGSVDYLLQIIPDKKNISRSYSADIELHEAEEEMNYLKKVYPDGEINLFKVTTELLDTR